MNEGGDRATGRQTERRGKQEPKDRDGQSLEAETEISQTKKNRKKRE